MRASLRRALTESAGASNLSLSTATEPPKGLISVVSAELLRLTVPAPALKFFISRFIPIPTAERVSTLSDTCSRESTLWPSRTKESVVPNSMTPSLSHAVIIPSALALMRRRVREPSAITRWKFSSLRSLMASRKVVSPEIVPDSCTGISAARRGGIRPRSTEPLKSPSRRGSAMTLVALTLRSKLTPAPFRWSLRRSKTDLSMSRPSKSTARSPDSSVKRRVWYVAAQRGMETSTRAEGNTVSAIAQGRVSSTRAERRMSVLSGSVYLLMSAGRWARASSTGRSVTSPSNSVTTGSAEKSAAVENFMAKRSSLRAMSRAAMASGVSGLHLNDPSRPNVRLARSKSRRNGRSAFPSTESR